MTSKKILITSGPTAVPLDPMRVITNRSTGEMGRLLANALSRPGCSVTLLESSAVTAVTTLKRPVAKRPFYFFDELAALLEKELPRKYDIVVHAAAVSDFKLKTPVRSKISSSSNLSLNLVTTPKLINTFKAADPGIFLVGFKLETSLEKKFILAKTRPLFIDAKCDVVLANAYINGQYQACFITPDGTLSKTFTDKASAVKALSTFIDKARI